MSISYFCVLAPILIKRLAMQHLKIKEDHIRIFAKTSDEEGNNNILSIYNKVVVQLTLDEIYISDPKDNELEFTEFQNNEELFMSINQILGDKKDANIFLYMYDNGNRVKIGGLNFLDIYFNFYNIEHSSLYIFNDSCKSYWMIKKINFYFTLSDIIKKRDKSVSSKELYFLASIGNKISPSLTNYNKILSIEKEFSNYVQTNRNIFYYLRNRNMNATDIKNSIIDFQSKFAPEQITYLELIFDCYKSMFSIPNNYKNIHKLFENGADIIQMALDELNITISQFLNILEDFNKKDLSWSEYEKHDNHFIITSSDENGYSMTFTTMKIDEKNKICAGSPAMGAFIIGSLINASLDKFNLDEIAFYAYGQLPGYIAEYAVQYPKDAKTKKKRKAYLRLLINQWTSNNKKMVMTCNHSYPMKKVNIQNVMESIGFQLSKKCNLTYCNKGDYLYLSTPKMEPFVQKTKTKIHVIPVRFVIQSKPAIFVPIPLEVEEYYSDDNETNDSGQLNVHSSNEDITSFTKSLLNNTDYNIKIENLDSIKKEIKGIDEMYFAEAAYEAFNYALAKIIDDENFKYIKTDKTYQGLPPIYILSMLEAWIEDFFPSYKLFDNADKLTSLYYNFMVTYQIHEPDIKNIFYNCMNVADQVASSIDHSSKKAAYYQCRLKSVGSTEG